MLKSKGLSRSLIALTWICAINNHLSARTFTSEEGVTIEAEIISVDPRDRATLRRDDGQLFRDVPIEFFSDSDRKYIRKWRQDQLNALKNAEISKESRVRITVGTGRDDDFNEYDDLLLTVTFDGNSQQIRILKGGAIQDVE